MLVLSSKENNVLKVCRIALLGAGKTGSFVKELCENRADIALKVYDSKNPLKEADLEQADVVISFLTGEVFSEYLELLLKGARPVVTGSTGFQFPRDIETQLHTAGATWVHATNFALGMTLVKRMIEILANGRSLFHDNEITQHIHEVHHTKKLDAPSGTALSWHTWAGAHGEITSERTGDVIGDHELVFETPFERITLKHEAKNRRVFAEGALWAALELVRHPHLYQNGLLDIHQMTRLSTQGNS